jgi:hypothetical protein
MKQPGRFSACNFPDESFGAEAIVDGIRLSTVVA